MFYSFKKISSMSTPQAVRWAGRTMNYRIKWRQRMASSDKTVWGKQVLYEWPGAGRLESHKSTSLAVQRLTSIIFHHSNSQRLKATFTLQIDILYFAIFARINEWKKKWAREALIRNCVGKSSSALSKKSATGNEWQQ